MGAYSFLQEAEGLQTIPKVPRMMSRADLRLSELDTDNPVTRSAESNLSLFPGRYRFITCEPGEIPGFSANQARWS